MSFLMSVLEEEPSKTMGMVVKVSFSLEVKVRAKVSPVKSSVLPVPPLL